MSTTAQLVPARTGALSALGDYAQLVKLRVTTLVMICAWCGAYLASLKSGVSSISWATLNAVLGVGLVAGGTAALNQVMERDLDAFMRRTQRRPLPAGRMGTYQALVFALALVLAGIAYLAVTTNLLAAELTLATSAAYLGAYTPLKRLHPICTFIGAFPGAMPPLLGWAALRGRVEWEAIALAAIVFVWQFPHFHSIAWLYAEDYDRARIRMLPVVEKDGRSTAHQIIFYSVLMIPAALAPTFMHFAGWTYFFGAFALTIALFWFGWRLAMCKAEPLAAVSKPPARHLLQATVIYLPLLFTLLMVTAIA
jgi:heme o synthase